MRTTDRQPQHWLINPRSGNGAGARLLAALHNVPNVTAVEIHFPSLIEQVSAIPLDTSIVVAGGDGTCAALLSVATLGTRKVTCIPLGTANDLARELGIVRLIKGHPYRDLPALIADLPTTPFAVWDATVDGHTYPFTNYLSIGYEGAVVRDFSSWRSRTAVSGRLIHRIAYTIFGVAHGLYRVHGLTVRTDSGFVETIPASTGLILTNIMSHLGLGISTTHSSPSDDILECVSVPNVLSFASMIGASYGLLTPPPPCARGRTITITGIKRDTPMQVDGETAPSILGGEVTATLRHFACVASTYAP